MTNLDKIREISGRYGWPEMPELEQSLAAGIVPQGFGTLVGKTITLFKGQSWERAIDHIFGPRLHWQDWLEREEQTREVVSDMCRLRMAIALHNCSK